jgi:hypothetical protein
MKLEQLKEAGFVEVGQWKLGAEGQLVLQGTPPRVPAVYVHLVDDQVHYVGSAKRSVARRMRSYEISRRMRTAGYVRNLIGQRLGSGSRVATYILIPNEPLQWRGLPVDPILGIEQGLIEIVCPPWNRRGIRRRRALEDKLSD